MRVGRAQPVEQVKGLIQDPARASFVAIDLVDDDDGPQAVLEGLLRDEARLRHGAVDRIDEQQHAIDHGQHPLDFAAEISMSRRVHDVDSVVAPGNRRILGQDRDPAFALQIIRIHDAFLQILARIERTGLAQQLIDEGGLAMIDVRDNGDVAKFLSHSEVPGRKPTIIGSLGSGRPRIQRSAMMGIEKAL